MHQCAAVKLLWRRRRIARKADARAFVTRQQRRLHRLPIVDVVALEVSTPHALQHTAMLGYYQRTRPTKNMVMIQAYSTYSRFQLKPTLYYAGVLLLHEAVC